LTAFCAHSQSPVRIGLFGGVSQYQGDLTGRLFTGRFAKPALGITASYDLSPRLALRGGVTFSGLEASDRYHAKPELQDRNLSFETKLTDFSLVGEYTFFNLDDVRWSPYLFGGVGLFRYNPFTTDSAGRRQYLQPLGTEGQGLPGHTAGKAYELTQFSLPFGAGLTYALNDRLQVGLEFSFRKTFTDYIDDVSTTYADPDALQAARGPRAVELAFRTDEVVPGASYPRQGSLRGNARNKDFYYFTGLRLQFRLGQSGGKGKYGCPVVRQ